MNGPPPGLGELVGHWLPGRWVCRPLTPGFSGGGVWLVETASDRFVLKPFPTGTTPERARGIHAWMGRARAAGVVEVPAVHRTVAGDSIVAAADGLWELIAFVAGAPVVQPTGVQASAALAAVARLHRGTAEPNQPGDSPAIRQRVAAARRMIDRSWAALLAGSAANAEAGSSLSLQAVVRERLAAAVRWCRDRPADRWLSVVAGLEGPAVRSQWVLRDIWNAHVLFDSIEPARVSGLIDYHASGIDTPATDVARLLGSWLAAEAIRPDWWEVRLAAYEAIWPLLPIERRLIPFLAASSVVFGLDNWFRWTLEEGRQFGSTAQVAGRLDQLLKALPTALDLLDNWARKPV